MVDADSTVLEVYGETPAECTQDDIDQWVVIDNPANMQSVMDDYDYTFYAYFGLFWQDLSDFFSDCAVADACSDDYETDYPEGAAVGVAMYADVDYATFQDYMDDYYSADTQQVAFCLYATNGCVEFTTEYYYDSSAYYYGYLYIAYYDDSDYSIDADYPEYVSYLTEVNYSDLDDSYAYGFSEYMFMMMDWDYSSDDLDGGMYFWRW